MSQTIDQVYRDYKAQGIPASGEHVPSKAEIRALLKMIQNSGGQAVTRNTLTALKGVTPPNENYMGIVLTGPEAGYYSRSGGAWVFGRPFPDTVAGVALSGSGTAQTGTLNPGVNPASVLFYFAEVDTPNIGPLELTIGGVQREVLNAAGNPLSPGEWTGGVQFRINPAGKFQLINEAGAAAAAAQSATFADERADDADAAAQRAENAAASFSEIGTNFKTVANLLADTTLGYTGSGADTEVDTGDIITAQGFRYEVVASGAVDWHVETAGGVKLYVLDNEFAALGSTDEAALELAQEAGITNLSGLSAEADDLNNVPEFDPRPMFDGTILSIGGGGVRDIHLPSLPRLYRSSLSDDRKIVESEYWPHAGGYMYTGAMDGCVFRGHEYYFVQNGTRHQQAGNTGGLSGIVSYLRNADGTFTTQKLISAGVNENVYLAGVATSLDGQRIIISVGVQEAPSGDWKGARVYVVQRTDSLGTLAVVGSPHSTGLEIDDMVPYGKPISVPTSQNILLSMYGATGGSKLYRSSGSYLAPSSFSELLELFPATSSEGFAGVSNEVDLGYWGDLLVAVCRRQTGGTINNATYRMTADLTGSTGWQAERELPGLGLIYPRIPQYTPADAPLVITATAADRARAIYGVMSSASHLWSTKLATGLGGAGSPTLVRTDHGFGVMQYQDAGGPWGAGIDSRTRVLHNYARMDSIAENLDLLEKSLSDLSYLRENSIVDGVCVVGNCHRFNAYLEGSANPNGITMWIRPLRDLEVDAVYVPIDKVASGADLAPIADILSASDSVVSSGSAGAVVQGAAVKPIRLPVANVTLQAGVPYKIRLTYSSISGGARVRYNNVPLNRTPINGSAFEYLGIGTSTYSTGQLPCLGLEVR